MKRSLFSRRKMSTDSTYPLSTSSRSYSQHQPDNDEGDSFPEAYPVVTASSSVYSDNSTCMPSRSPESSLYSFRISGGLQIPPKSCLRTYHSLLNIRMSKQAEEPFEVNDNDTQSMTDNETIGITLEEFPYQKLYNNFSEDSDSSDCTSIDNHSITDSLDYLSTEKRHKSMKPATHRAKFSVATEEMIRSFEQELSAFDHLGEVLPDELSEVDSNPKESISLGYQSPDVSINSTGQTFGETPPSPPFAYSDTTPRTRSSLEPSPSNTLRRRASVMGTLKSFKTLGKRIISGSSASSPTSTSKMETFTRSPTINMRFWSESIEQSS